MTSRRTRLGFTIVEASLANVFISFILIAIVVITGYIMTIYQKGLVIKAVNSASQDLTAEFQKYIKATAPDGVSSVYRKMENIQINGATQSVPVNGAFCTGKVSYVWNSGYVLSSDTYSGYQATVDGYGGGTFTLLRVNDPTQVACRGSHGTSGRNYQVDAAAGSNAVELLNHYEYNLAIYDLDTSTPVFHDITSQDFINGSFILGTLKGDIDITANGEYCTAAKDSSLSSDATYCSVGKFNFAATATGERS